MAEQIKIQFSKPVGGNFDINAETSGFKGKTCEDALNQVLKGDRSSMETKDSYYEGTGAHVAEGN